MRDLVGEWMQLNFNERLLVLVFLIALITWGAAMWKWLGNDSGAPIMLAFIVVFYGGMVFLLEGRT